MNDTTVWILIAGLGAGTFLIRFSFLGLLGGRELPEWLIRHLRYVPVAVLPGMIAPLVVWPAATGGMLDPARTIAALVALAIGAWFRSVLGAIFGGMTALYLALYVLN